MNLGEDYQCMLASQKETQPDITCVVIKVHTYEGYWQKKKIKHESDQASTSKYQFTGNKGTENMFK